MDLSRLGRIQKVFTAGFLASTHALGPRSTPDRLPGASQDAALRMPVDFVLPSAAPAASSSVATPPSASPSPLANTAGSMPSAASFARGESSTGATARDDGRKTITFEFDAREGPKLANIGLKGSFDPASGRYDPMWNGGRPQPMFDDGTHGDRQAGDGVYTAQVSLDKNDPSSFQWGVQGDILGPAGQPVQTAKWLMLTEEPPRFSVDGKSNVITYAPTSNRQMGVQKVGDDGISFKTWSPAMGTGPLAGYSLHVEVIDNDGRPVYALPMQKDDRTGIWTAATPEGWSGMKGLGYRYAALNAQGQPLQRHFGDGSTKEVLYADPCARYLQGPQRGLERINVDPVLGIETGWYDSSNSGGPNYSINPAWGRFTVPGHANAERVTLRLQDDQGRTLTKADLLERLGPPTRIPYDQATPQQKQNVDILRRWQTDTSAPVSNYGWLDHVADDGAIDLQRVGDASSASWITAINNFDGLVGLRYQFEVRENGQLVGDKNANGILESAEARATPFNDPYANVITAHPGNERLSLIKTSSFKFQHDNVPRKETDFKKFVIYEAHVGSFMGSRDNEKASNFGDLINHLDYVEKLGANTIELLPVQEFGGTRDWGYTPDFMFAGTDAYGFEMPRDEAVKRGLIDADEQPGASSVWVSGTDAFKLFVDEAHKRGLNVLSDVVYNHVAGRPDAGNPLDLIDGDQQSFFKWNGDHESQTPWGAKPNYGAQAVKDFYANNAAQQLDEFHVDGMRFDFVQVLHDTGSVDEKREGMNALRQINRTVQYIKPGAYTVAEDFTHNWLVAADLDKNEWQGDMEKRGMGFGGVWNDSFHHQLLGNIETLPGYNMDNLMGAITGHAGVTGWDRAVVFSHSHDEVGNSGRWVLRAAAHSVKEADVMQPYPRAMGRSAAAITLTSAGVPMIWQGEEQLANNDFKHAMPSTWGTDAGWLKFPVTPDRLDVFKHIASLPEQEKRTEAAKLPPQEQPLFARYDAMAADQRAQADINADKNGMFRLYHDLIALRGSSPALAAATTIQSIYTHNDDRVMAYERKDGTADCVVVTNFKNEARDNYGVNLPAGRWRVVLNSDDRAYGGGGAGTHGIVEGGQPLNLPAGGSLVLERIG